MKHFFYQLTIIRLNVTLAIFSQRLYILVVYEIMAVGRTGETSVLVIKTIMIAVPKADTAHKIKHVLKQIRLSCIRHVCTSGNESNQAREADTSGHPVD